MKLRSIQILRGLAAFLVVYTHCICQMGVFGFGRQQRMPISTSLGTFGVDLFFVISGFIIYHSAARLNGRKEALSFLWHRFRRINPAYYAAILLILLTWIPSWLRHQRPPLSGMQSLSSIILLPFPGSTGSILYQAWSLSFEWYFYLLFFGIILFRTRKKAGTIGLLIGAMVLLGLALRNYQTGVLSFYTDPVIIEFMLGVGVGFVYSRWTPGKRTAMSLLLPGILLGGTLMLTGFYDVEGIKSLQTPIPKCIHALCWGGTAAFIVGGSVFLERYATEAFFRRCRLILLLGNASYSIYLVHGLVIMLIYAFYLRVGFFLPPDLAIPVEAVIATLGGLLFYKWVETPLLGLLKKRKNVFQPIPFPPAGT